MRTVSLAVLAVGGIFVMALLTSSHESRSKTVSPNARRAVPQAPRNVQADTTNAKRQVDLSDLFGGESSNAPTQSRDRRQAEYALRLLNNGPSRAVARSREARQADYALRLLRAEQRQESSNTVLDTLLESSRPGSRSALLDELLYPAQNPIVIENATTLDDGIGFGFTHATNGVTATSTRIGDFTFHNFSDGTTGSSTRIDPFTFHNVGGTFGTSTRIGDMTFHNLNGTTGTSTQVGGFSFHRLSDGTFGTSTQVGDFTFTNLSGGTTFTTTQIGSP